MSSQTLTLSRALGLIGLLLATPTAAAQTREPARFIATAGAGGAVRLARRRMFDQDRFAPWYVDLSAAYLWPHHGPIAHGPVLGVSFNAVPDGSDSLGVAAGEQWVLSPGYMVSLPLAADALRDMYVQLKATLPLSITPVFNPGAEIAAAFVYLVRAGLGVYAELGVSGFLGGENERKNVSVHPLVSLDLGCILDWEFLP